MSVLINASIRVDKLPKEKFINGKKTADGKTPVYYNMTISVSDETRYGNNVAITDSQTREERDAKKPKNYLGNGKVVWTDGNIVLAEKQAIITEAEIAANNQDNDDLPF